MSKDTTIRVITAVVGLIMFFVVIFADMIVFDIALGVIILMMLFEVFYVFKSDILLKIFGVSGSVLIIFTLAYDKQLFVPALVLYVAVMAAAAVFGHKKISFADMAAVLFATLYITVFMSFVARAREMDEFGLYYVCLIFACAWMTDTGGYFIGRFFGRHKLVPEISPKKTVEGAIGAVVFSVIGCVLLGVFANIISNAQSNLLLLAAVGAVGSCTAQVGDLIASQMKRTCGVKDFGNIMPGHGGVLDRFDSVIMTAPLVYYFCAYFANMGMNIF